MADINEGRGGRTILIIIVVIALIAAVTFAMGLWNLDSSGSLKAPEVKVSAEGGEVPNVDLNTGSIDVGTKTETVKVPEVDVSTHDTDIKLPTIDVKKADNDGKATK